VKFCNTLVLPKVAPKDVGTLAFMQFLRQQWRKPVSDEYMTNSSPEANDELQGDEAIVEHEEPWEPAVEPGEPVELAVEPEQPEELVVEPEELAIPISGRDLDSEHDDPLRAWLELEMLADDPADLFDDFFQPEGPAVDTFQPEELSAPPAAEAAALATTTRVAVLEIDNTGLRSFPPIPWWAKPPTTPRAPNYRPTHSSQSLEIEPLLSITPLPKATRDNTPKFEARLALETRISELMTLSCLKPICLPMCNKAAIISSNLTR
jgi:hypothetical protein